MIRNVTFGFVSQPGSGQGDDAAWFGETGEVAEIKVIGREVHARIEGENGVEEVRLEGEIAGVGLDGVDGVGAACVLNALPVFVCAEP